MNSFHTLMSMTAKLAVLALLAAGPGLLAQKTTANETSLSEVVNSNNQFAFDLYRKINAHDSGKNIFVSPFSISTALAMTYEGSSNNTRKQMGDVLRLNLADAQRQEGFSTLLAQTKAGTGKHYKLNVANALWGQKQYHFEPPFISAASKYYGGGLKSVDFANNTEGTREEINRWVEDHTENMIRELLKQGDIKSNTPLVLTNAIYFKGNWASQFKAAATKDDKFNVSDTKKVEVPMMRQTGHFPFVRIDSMTAIDLPYEGNDLSMIVILPSGDAEKLGEELSVDTIHKLRSQMRSREVDVTLPRFKLEARYGLGPILSEMGMPDAFSEMRADFSGMTGSPNLYISAVIHKARIEVNEEGSEAAAATAVIMIPKSMEVDMKETFRADRPFIFMIVHKTTGSILFMGRMSDPTN